MQDAAARALWLLARGDDGRLCVESSQLGCDLEDLAKALISLLEAAEAQEVRPAGAAAAGVVHGEPGV